MKASKTNPNNSVLGPKGGKKNKAKNKQPKKQAELQLNVVSAPAAQAARIKTNQQKIRFRKDGCYVENRELILTLTGAMEFAVKKTIHLNPGLKDPFLWSSGIATRYEKYRFTHMHIRSVTRCGTGTSGSILIVPDYDPTDDAPTTEVEASQYKDSVEDVPWKNILCSLDPKRMNGISPQKFNRYGPATGDLRTSDSGKVHICCVGMQNNVDAVSKIYIDYGVEFYIPQISEAYAIKGGMITGGGTKSAANPLGTLPVMNPNCVGCHVNANSEVTLPNIGTYLASLDIDGTGITNALVPSVVSGAIEHAGLSGDINSAATSSAGVYSFDTLVKDTIIKFAVAAGAVTNAQLKLASGPGHSFEL
jgi:hypothetical protein